MVMVVMMAVAPVVFVVAVVVKVMAVSVVIIAVVRVVQLPRVAVVRLNERGVVEALFQDGAHHPELRGDLPACLELTAAGRPVALALPPHVIQDDLKHTENREKFNMHV